MSGIGRRLTQTVGRKGEPKSAHRAPGSSCTHGIPAGLPCGMPGIGDEIEGAMQHAPHFGRHSIPEDGTDSVVGSSFGVTDRYPRPHPLVVTRRAGKPAPLSTSPEPFPPADDKPWHHRFTAKLASPTFST
jgi:hypothetical protein